MPRLDGFQTCALIRYSNRCSHIPVVMLNDGQVVLLRPPSHARMMASIQAWADAQPLPPEGFVSPVVLSFQPRV